VRASTRSATIREIVEPTRTETDPSEGAPPVDAQARTLTVVHHPDPANVGARALLPDAGEVLLGRGPTCALASALDHDRVSRAHAKLVCHGDGALTLVDLDSRNGTHLNGERVARAPVALGDVIALGGRVSLLVHRTRSRFAAPRHAEMVGIGAGLAGVLEDVRRVAQRGTTVAIVGETGVGKELVARELHRASGRPGPFVAVNCGGVADALLQSELFGHVRGAFTGADRARPGLVDTAREGTLFLDEIADASPGLQASLLRLFETGEYRPVGSDRVAQADVRVVVAAQPLIHERVATGAFRADLWNRLARWVIAPPSLRERPEDVALLAARFASHHATRPVALTAKLVAALTRFSWPGNVRELQAVMERAVVTAADARPDAEEVTLDLDRWLAERLDAHPPDATLASVPDAPARRASLPRPTRPELEALLEAHGGSVRAVARELDVARRTLYRWMDALGIDRDAYR